MPVALAETRTFLRSVLPEPPLRILEVGCGRGALALALAADGYAVTAIDTDADAIEGLVGVDARVADFLLFEDGPFDAVLFTRSLHHLCPLDAAIDRAIRLLVPGGLLVAEEFAVEAVDRRTAEWFGDLRSILLGRAPVVDDPLARWHDEHHHDPPLHTGFAMETEIRRRLPSLSRSTAPYLYRSFAAEPASERIAAAVFEVERRRIGAGTLAAVGLRLVARRGPPPPRGRPRSVVGGTLIRHGGDPDSSWGGP